MKLCRQLTSLSVVELRMNYQILNQQFHEKQTGRGAHEGFLKFLLAPSSSLTIETYLRLSNLVAL